MKTSLKSQQKHIQYRTTHHEIDIGEDDELAIVGIVLTIIPLLVVALPAIWISEMYGSNPMHWWPMFWGTKVTIPEREPFHAYDEKFEKVVEEYGPTRIYVVDYNTLKFRTQKDATLYCLKNLS